MDPQIGKLLFIGGLTLAGLGALIWWGGRWFGWLGRLPGDIHVEGQRGGSFHFPVVTCIVVSLVLSGLLALVRRFYGQ